MKITRALILFCFILFLFSCSDDRQNIVDPPSSSGNLSVIISKSDAPENVTEVMAELSRAGFSPISGMMDITGSGQAELSLTEIPEGAWHLKIDAMDNQGTILYTGETDIYVVSDQVTNVSLTLTSVSSGTGTVNIVVNWENGTTSLWIDNPGNPVLTEHGNYPDYGIGQPFVLYFNGLYRMWFTGTNGFSDGYVHYAESQDGINWSAPVSSPVLSPGEYGSWDSQHVGAGPIIVNDGLLMMYYSGWGDSHDAWKIGLATSTDGINWTKEAQPILSGSGWDYQMGASSAIIIDGKIYLYYYGHQYYQNRQIGLAISDDGYTFQKYGNGPIMSPDQPWELDAIGYPSVIDNGNQYMMIYQVASPNGQNGFGAAYSQDGKSWTKDENNPVFNLQNLVINTGSMAYPNLVKTSTEYRLYYTCFPENQKMVICLAQKPLE